MTPQGATLSYRRLRAPGRHGDVLIDPPLVNALSLVEKNQTLLQGVDYNCQGRSFTSLAEEARNHLLTRAHAYTTAYRDAGDLSPLDVSAPILLAGHQPELFHGGVWFKTLVLSALGKKLNGHAINLLIDNDDARSAAIRVPGGSVDEPRVESVPLDGWSEEVPYEQRAVVDRDLFTSFGERVASVLSELVAEPLIGRLWPLALEALTQTGNLGACVAQARHRLEGQWGLQTLELPLSAACSAAPFHWFTSHLLAQLPRFHEIYNAALTEYRRVNRLRSRSHPVANLATDEDWLESPFWIWSSDEPRRRRLFVRCRGDDLDLSDRRGRHVRLPLSADRDAQSAVEQLAQLSGQGVKIRPRALITTMYARLFLGDLFLHGIGGTKYDQLTDLIVRRFFGIQPTAFLTTSATTTLPIQRQRPEMEELLRTKHDLRDLRYNPQRYLETDEDNVAARLAAEKQQWITTLLPRGERLQRHREITRINSALQNYVAAKRNGLLGRCDRLNVALCREAILASREYSFCLFPEETLRPLLLELSSGTS